MAEHGSTATTGTGTYPVALAAMLGLAGVCWIVALPQMRGMDMGTATPLGSFPAFIAVWLPMMAAMMLPGTAPAVARHARATGGLRGTPLFAGSYLAVWALVGIAVYVLYRPHGPVVAAAVLLAAGAYECTLLPRRWRHRDAPSGLVLGLCCVGSSLGPMLVLLALGVMSVTWMCVVAAVVTARKLLPVRAGVDVLVGLATAGLGLLILVVPGSVPAM